MLNQFYNVNPQNFTSSRNCSAIDITYVIPMALTQTQCTQSPLHFLGPSQWPCLHLSPPPPTSSYSGRYWLGWRRTRPGREIKNDADIEISIKFFSMTQFHLDRKIIKNLLFFPTIAKRKGQEHRILSKINKFQKCQIKNVKS